VLSGVAASMPLARVDRTSLREWVARMSDPDDGRLAPATVTKNVQVFNKLMRAALEDRLIAANPVERLPVPRIEREEIRFLTPAELSKLADVIDQRYRAFVLLAGYGGLRLGELLGLRWKHVDTQRRQVHVSETLASVRGQISFGPPKTRAAIRTVTLPGFVVDELRALGGPAGDPIGLVFTSPEGQPIRPNLFRRRFGIRPSKRRGSRRCAFTTSVTPQSRSGLLPEDIPSRSLRAPATPVSPSFSIATDTCSRTTTTS